MVFIKQLTSTEVSDASSKNSLNRRRREPRHFNNRQREALFILSGGFCQICFCVLKPNNWHPDHIIPYAKGGATSVSNGQATCATCNLAKGAK